MQINGLHFVKYHNRINHFNVEFCLFYILLNKYSILVDVISGRHVARILVSRPEEIRLYGNGIVYPISTFLSTQARIAADELFRSYQ